MNPIFDLIVIGVIVFIVFLNLYYSRDQSVRNNSFSSSYDTKFSALNQIERNVAVRPHASVHHVLK